MWRNKDIKYDNLIVQSSLKSKANVNELYIVTYCINYNMTSLHTTIHKSNISIVNLLSGANTNILLKPKIRKKLYDNENIKH